MEDVTDHPADQPQPPVYPQQRGTLKGAQVGKGIAPPVGLPPRHCQHLARTPTSVNTSTRNGRSAGRQRPSAVLLIARRLPRQSSFMYRHPSFYYFQPAMLLLAMLDIIVTVCISCTLAHPQALYFQLP